MPTLRNTVAVAAAALWPCLGSSGHAQTWPADARLSGHAFLTPQLARLQDDPAASPVGLWLERGAASWTASSAGPGCQSCHGAPASLARGVAQFPRLAADGRTLINLEDQIGACRARSGRAPSAGNDDEDVLALSAHLQMAARGQPIDLQPPADAALREAWQARLSSGAQAWTQRVGRINLACMHCHDQNVGKTFRSDVTSPAHPTGFPVYRMRWQTLGSIERRLRACYSGVQAQLPAPGDPLLRDLELFLKVRGHGLPLEGPSIRR